MCHEAADDVGIGVVCLDVIDSEYLFGEVVTCGTRLHGQFVLEQILVALGIRQRA